MADPTSPDLPDARADAHALRDPDALRRALSVTGIAAWEWFPGADTGIWTDNFETVLGVQPGAFDGTVQSFVAILHPDDREPVAEASARAAETGGPYHVEFRVPQSDGSVRWIECEGQIYHDHAGQARNLVGVVRDITERKRTEDELARRERSLRALTDHSPDIIARYDRDLRFVYVNPAIAIRADLAVENVLGKTNAELGIPRDPEKLVRWQDAIRQVFADGQERTLEMEIERPADVTYYQTRLTPELTADGTVESVLTVTRDVTGLVEATAALRDRSELLATTLASIGDAVIAANGEGRVVFMNAVAERLTGWPAEEARGRAAADVFRALDEESRAPREGPLPRTLETGQPADVEGACLLVARDGAERPIEAASRPIRDEAGRQHGAVLVFRDIAEERRRDEARSRLAAIVEGSDDAIVSTDLNGIVTSWNRAAERIYGWPAEEIVGQSKNLVIPPDMPDELPGILSRIRNGERIEHYDTSRIRKDGSRITLSMGVSPVRDESGRIVGAATIARDVTESRRAEAAARYLAEAGEILASSLDYHATLQQVAEMVVPTLADWCLVDLYRDGVLERVAMCHADPARRRYAEEVSARYPSDPNSSTGLYGVVRSGEPRMISHITDEMLRRGARDDEYYRILSELGLRSYICVPMAAHGKVLGAITFLSAESRVAYGPADLALAQELGRRAALAMDSALQYEAAQEEIAQRRRTEEELEERTRLTSFGADVGSALVQQADLPDMLRGCCEAFVRHLDAAFARIWTLSADGRTLELQASAGQYTRTDGTHSQVPVGALKIGRIAEERRPHLTNSVATDPRISDPDWARREGMVAFAGYPLVVEDRLIGVVALFSRQTMTDSAFGSLSNVAHEIAIGIERKRSEDELRHSKAEIEELNARLRRAMRETHHRVKNNLQIIAALADMQATQDAETVPREEMARLGGQVRALAAVHEILTNEAARHGDSRFISSREVLEKLASLIQETTPGRAILTDIEEIRLSARQGSSLAIIANELVTNAFKHGATEALMRFYRAGSRVRLEVGDNGPGFAEAFDPSEDERTGLALVQHIAEWDLQGAMLFGNRPDRAGGLVTIEMPFATQTVTA